MTPFSAILLTVGVDFASCIGFHLLSYGIEWLIPTSKPNLFYPKLNHLAKKIEVVSKFFSNSSLIPSNTKYEFTIYYNSAPIAKRTVVVPVQTSWQFTW
jgi:hypothetical protein